VCFTQTRIGNNEELGDEVNADSSYLYNPREAAKYRLRKTKYNAAFNELPRFLKKASTRDKIIILALRHARYYIIL